MANIAGGFALLSYITIAGGFAQLHNYSNAMKAFGYSTNDFGVVIFSYLVNIYIIKAILVIQ